MKILILDGYNLMHRARSGFTRGESFVIYNFFRGLRPLVEMFKPDKAYFVLEGHPKRRVQIDNNYKSNRKVDPSDPKYQKLVDFHRQKKIIIKMMELFPFTMLKHPDYECDDVIANMCHELSSEHEITVVSSDSDFYQLLEKENVTLYNPVKKKFIERPDYDYVTWKALRGDPTDNIPGIPGVGDKTALKLVNNSSMLKEFISIKNREEIFNRNIELIQLSEFSDEDKYLIESIQGAFSPLKLKSLFAGHGFSSMLKEKTWAKFCETFDHLDSINNSTEAAS